MQTRRSVGLALWLATLVACGDGELRDYGDPTSLALATESAGITAWIESPVSTDVTDSATPEVVIAAYVTEAEATPLVVTLSKLELDESGGFTSAITQPTEPNGESGKQQRFMATPALAHGDNRFVARIATPDRTRVRTLEFSLFYDGQAPGVSLALSEPEDPSQADACRDRAPLASPVTRLRSVCLHGRVTSPDGGPMPARVSVAGDEARQVEVGPDGEYATSLDLPVDQTSEIRVALGDGSVQTVASALITQDETAPSIRIESDIAETSATSLVVSATVQDPNEVVELAVESDRGGRRELPVSGGDTVSFEREIPLAVGDNTLVIVAFDGAGNEAREELTLTRVRVLQLGAPRETSEPLDIDVDRQALEELLGEDDQRSIDLVAIDLEPAVRQALARIREPERYAIDTSEWGPAERNLQRILRMTPDVADLSGTSMEELLQIANGVGLPAPRLLAQLLDMQPTEYIVDLDVAAKVIVDKLIGTHPNITRDEAGDPVLAVSVYDVFQELRPIAARFGATEGHPGFLSGETRGEVLEPGFLLTFPVTSNLTQYDAIDLSRRTKDYLFLLEGEQVLDFNVMTDAFGVVGLVHEPTVDLRFTLGESPTLPRAGSEREARPDPDEPGFFRGSGEAFALEPYLVEHIAAEIGYRQLRRAFADDDFVRVNRYDAGSIADAAVVEWERGWVTITTAGGLGAPPPPLYAWDLLTEVTEVRLHDDGLAQGEADMAFNLEGLPIGLTADELVERLRPTLSEQEAQLSELLVGTGALASSSADVFYDPGAGDEGVLMFRAEGDGNPIEYPVVGFFSDPELGDKVSVTEAAFGSADVEHEKVAANPGAVYYAADEDGSVYEIRVVESTAEGIGVEVRPAGDSP